MQYSNAEDSMNMRSIAALLFSLGFASWQTGFAGQISLADHAATILAADAAAGSAQPLLEHHETVPFSLPETTITPPPDAEMRFVSLGRVTFISDQWLLTDQTKRTLDAAVRYLTDHPGASRLLIRGHTDEVGSQRHNDGLSDRRAAAVLDYLTQHGVALTQIRWEGHGEHAPVDENWTRLGRARNRQVEVFAVFAAAAVPVAESPLSPDPLRRNVSITKTR